MAGASIQMGAAQVENLSEPNLHQKGMQMHEAQELALAEWIRLPTERPGRVQGPRYRAARARSYAMFKDEAFSTPH